MSRTVPITRAGQTQPDLVEGVVLIDPVTGETIPAPARTVDSTGQSFNPDSCVHAYGYSAGLLVTDTATDGTSTWVKTYSYTSGNLTGETKWVRA